MLVHISHTTRYTYDEPVTYGLQQIRLTPVDNPMQSVVDWSLSIASGSEQASYKDENGNHTVLALVDSGTQIVEVTATGKVQTHDKQGIYGQSYGSAPLWHFQQPTELTNPGKGVRALAKVISYDNILTSLHDLSAAILDVTPYTTGKTYVATDAEQALQAGHGVCQDHAQIFISAARHAGLPARYISGYLLMDGQIDQDASHAWAEIYINDLGWVGFDVSNGISPDERYVRIATGRDYKEAAPISGMRYGPSDESMIVSLQVQQ